MVAVSDIFFQGVRHQKLQLLVELIGHAAKVQKGHPQNKGPVTSVSGPCLKLPSKVIIMYVYCLKGLRPKGNHCDWNLNSCSSSLSPFSLRNKVVR